MKLFVKYNKINYSIIQSMPLDDYLKTRNLKTEADIPAYIAGWPTEWYFICEENEDQNKIMNQIIDFKEVSPILASHIAETWGKLNEVPTDTVLTFDPANIKTNGKIDFALVLQLVSAETNKTGAMVIAAKSFQIYLDAIEKQLNDNAQLTLLNHDGNDFYVGVLEKIALIWTNIKAKDRSKILANGWTLEEINLVNKYLPSTSEIQSDDIEDVTFIKTNLGIAEK